MTSKTKDNQNIAQTQELFQKDFDALAQKLVEAGHLNDNEKDSYISGLWELFDWYTGPRLRENAK
jgi:hypothetical protein